MELPQEQEVNEAEADSPEEGDEDVRYISNREKLGDVHVCGLGKPGEELGSREESSVRIISEYSYKESLRESTPDALHEGVIRALGTHLEVPGFGDRDEEETTKEQLRRLEELYQEVVEREKLNRSMFEKVVRSPKAWGVFAGVLAAAVAISIGAMIGKTELGDRKMGNDEAVAILEEYKDSLSANEVDDADDMGGVTIDEIDEIIAAANQSSAE
jgi:ATP-dependent protease HslVU (ClpYQ) ATPase subunit